MVVFSHARLFKVTRLYILNAFYFDIYLCTIVCHVSQATTDIRRTFELDSNALRRNRPYEHCPVSSIRTRTSDGGTRNVCFCTSA